MACGEFPYPRIPGTCVCCGTVIMATCPTCGEIRRDADHPDYRRLHFRLSTGSLAVASVCPACSDHPWSPSMCLRLQWVGELDETILGRDDTVPVQTWAEVL